jgi:predicted nuclease of predicted toxin-antitoxin system
VRFLADESCDFAVVAALRAAGYDVFAVAEINCGANDPSVLALARSEQRVLLTEDKDFGLLAYAGGKQTAGGILIRFPGSARSTLGHAVVSVVRDLGERMAGAFVVIEPGRARISAPANNPVIGSDRHAEQPTVGRAERS